jgi:ATP-binding cassette subfamily G (WHITE) protein 2 (SNQ2)
MDLAAVAQQASQSSDHSISEYPTSTTYQTMTLCHRSLVRMTHKKGPIVVTLIRHIVVAVFFGSIFYHLGDGTESSLYTNRLSLLFFCLVFLVVGHQQSIPSLYEDRLLFYRERGSKLYGAIPYWFSAWLIELPITLMNVLIFSVIVYKMSSLNTASGCFGYFFGQLLLADWASLFLCQLVAALSPSPQVAISAFPIALFIAVTFAGYIVYLPSLDGWLRNWAPYLSFMRYPYQGLVLNEFSNNNSTLPLGEKFITSLGFDDYTKSQVAPANVIFSAGFATLLLLALKYVDFERR